MGVSKYPALDITIESEVDTSALDDLMGELTGFQGIFEPALQKAQAFKDAIEEGEKQGLEVLGGFIVGEEQEQILDVGKHPYSQGILGTSITDRVEDHKVTIGNTINHIYPLSVELGADIYPKTRKFLKFQNLNGEIIFARESHPKPHPYVEPTAQVTKEYIANGVGVFREVCKKMDKV